MRNLALAMLWGACKAPTSALPTQVPPEPATTGSTADTAARGPCADPTLGLSLSLQPTQSITAARLEVEATDAVPVVAACIAEDDPDDVLFAEEITPAVSHALAVGGLRAETSYLCTAAATCPTPRARASQTWGSASASALSLELDPHPTLPWTRGYTLAAIHRNQNCPIVQGHPLVLWDDRGRVRWHKETARGFDISVEAHAHPTSPRIVWGGGGSQGGFPRVEDPMTGLHEAIRLPDVAGGNFHHDVLSLPDGRFVTLEARSDQQGADSWTGFAVRVREASEEISFTLESQALVDAGVLPPGTTQDPYHANALAWDDRDGAPLLVVSLCYVPALLGYDVARDEVAWVFARSQGWRLETADGDPLTEDDIPQCAHGIELVDGKLLLYDNGRVRGQSAASEWALDPVTRTAVRTWYWTEPGWYEPILGDIEEIAPGRVLITKGRRGCGARGTSLEVDRATGAVAVRRTFPNVMLYRSEHIDGCAIFGSTELCPDVARRYEEVRALLEDL